MTSRALVKITGDVSTFAADAQRGLTAALRRVDLDLRPIANQISTGLKRGAEDGADSFQLIDAEFVEVMGEITASADRHFDQIARKADDAAAEVAHDFGGAGEKIEGSFDEVGDKSKKEFDRVERNARGSADSIASVFKRLAVGLVAAFAGIQTGRFFIQAAQDAEDLGSAIANTQQIIKSTHNAAGLLATDIRDISKQLSLKIGVDSVEVQNAANILLTFKGVSKSVFPEAIGLAADLSAVLGSDLAGATLQLGKALNDPVRGIAALARAGVQFTDKQKATIKSLIAANDLLGAQAIILKEVKSQVGGVAIAGADTTDKLKVAFLDLKRAAGESLIEFIDQAGPVLIGLIGKLTPIIATVGSGIAAALEVALPLIDVFVSNLEDNLKLLQPAVKPLADILKAVLDILPKIIPALVQIGQAVLPVIASAVSAIAINLGPALGLFLQLAAGIVSALTPALTPLVAALAQVAVVAGGALMKALPELADATLKLVVALLPLVPLAADILVAFLPLAQPIVDIAVAVVQLAASISGPLAAVTGFLSEHSDAVLVVVSAFIAYKVAVIALEGPLLAAKVATIAFTAAQWLLNVALDANPIGLIVAAIALLVGGIILAWKHSEAFRKVVLAVWGAIKVAAVAIGNAFVTAFHAVVDFFVGLGRWFEELPGRIVSFFVNLPAMIGHFLLAAFDAGLKLIGQGIGLWLAAMIAIPHLLVDALLSLPKLLGDFISLVWSGIVALFHAGVDTVIFTFTELPGRILGALASLGSVIGGALSAAFRFAVRIVSDGVANIVSFIVSLPGKIVALVPKMIDAGVSLIKGLFSGLGKVGGFIADVGSGIVNAVKGALNHIIDKVNEGIASIEDNLPFSLPRIPRLAKGGLTTDTGLAVLHPRELVLPLEDRRAVDLLGQALAEADAGLRATGVKPSQDTSDISIRVFLGTQELTHLVDVQIDERNRTLKRRVTAGSGGRRGG